MKPTDILDAIGGIPEEYITEAKPDVSRRRASCTPAEQPVSDAGICESSIPADSASQKREHAAGKRISVWQRIVTAFAAAVACLVFICGGGFILQQVLYPGDQSDQENHRIRSEGKNFLGGTGEIHVSNNMELMYDDAFYYFDRGHYKAERSGGEITCYVENKDWFLPSGGLGDLCWDGEQFYLFEKVSLYRIDMQGNYIDGKPFYQINTRILDKPLIMPTAINEMGYYIEDITKLSDGYYCINCGTYVNASGDDRDAIEPFYKKYEKMYCCIYQPDTGQEDLITTAGYSNWIDAVTDGDNVVVSVHDSSTDTLSLTTLDPVMTRDLISTDHTCWGISDGNLYLVDYFDLKRVDLATGTVTTVLGDLRFDDFLLCDGKLFALYYDGDQLICSDPDCTNPEILCNFRTDLTDTFAEIFEKGNAFDPSIIEELLAVDENYLLLRLHMKYNSEDKLYCISYVLIDRSTGAMRLFPDEIPVFEEDKTEDPESAETDVPEDEAPVYENNPIMHGANILGGTGEIRPAGNMKLLYDDYNVYLDYLRLRGDRYGGVFSQTEPLPDSVDAAGFVSDGALLYQIKEDGLYYVINGVSDMMFFPFGDEDFRKARAAIYGDPDSEAPVHVQTMGVRKLTDMDYLIYVSFAGDQNVQADAAHSFDYTVLWNGWSQECTELPDQCLILDVVGDGETFYYQPYGRGDLVSITLDPVSFGTIPEPEHRILSSLGWCMKDGCLYYMSPDESNLIENAVYCKYDLKTGACSVISSEPEFDSFIRNDEMFFGIEDPLFPESERPLYACSKDGTKIIRFDPELQNTSVVFDCGRDLPEAVRTKLLEAQAQLQAEGNDVQKLITALESVNQEWLMFRLCDQSYGLYYRYAEDNGVHNAFRCFEAAP